VQADGLRDHVTAGWDSVIENSSLLVAVTEQVQPILIAEYKERYSHEIQLAQARINRAIKDRLAAMPEHRQGSTPNSGTLLWRRAEQAGTVRPRAARRH
jgi:hypothetical protein